MDYKGLESTICAPIYAPDPPEKGSILCHLGLPLQNCWLFASFFVFGYNNYLLPLQKVLYYESDIL